MESRHKSVFSLFITIFILFLIPAQALSQPMPPGGGMQRMMTPEEFEAMRVEARTMVTNAQNFNKRIDLAREWAFKLLRRHQRAVESTVPPGTFPRLRDMERTEPLKAYAELDRILAEFERLDASPSAADEPYRPGRPGLGGGMGRKQGMGGRPGMAREPMSQPPMTAKQETEAPSEELNLINPASGVKLWAKVYHPKDASRQYPALAYIPGAVGYGSQYANEQAASIIASSGFVVAIFDPDGRGKSVGKEDYNGKIHQDGLNALLKQLVAHPLTDKNNVGVVSLSYGVAMAAGALARYPDNPPVKYLIDVEGPSDRRRITLNDLPVALQTLGNHLSTEVEFWKEREPLTWISQIKASYLRIQSERDHVQPDNGHAIDLVNAATDKKRGGGGVSPWTRINGPENNPNEVYTAGKSPRYLPGKGLIRTEELLGYIREMTTLAAGSAAAPGVFFKTVTPAPLAKTDPVRLFVEFHVEAVIKDEKDFALETELLERLAGMMEQHGAKGSFMLLDIYPRMAQKYGSGANLVGKLEGDGHEIGVHFHPWGPREITLAETIRQVRGAGANDVVSLTTSFHTEPVLDVERSRYGPGEQRERVNQMINDMYENGITSAFRWCMPSSRPLTPPRDRWTTTGWESCKEGKAVNDPAGTIVAVGDFEGAGYTFTEEDDSFDKTLAKLEAFMSRSRGDGINYYPVAIHDYYFLTPSGAKANNRIVSLNEDRLRKFDEFLTKIDMIVKDGKIKYTTRKELAREYSLSANKPLRMGRAGASATSQAVLNVFYLVHVHSASASTPEFFPVPDNDYEGTAKTLMAIAETLEKRGAKGTFHFMQGFAETAARYRGPAGNVITKLETRGHEVGAHVHTDANGQWRKTIEAVRRAGAKNVKSLSGVKTAMGDIKTALNEAVSLGIKVITSNSTPLDPRVIRGMEGASEWGSGGNAAVYKETGSFIFPWRPNIVSGKLHENDPAGRLVYVDNISMSSWVSRGALDSEAFERLAGYFDGAVKNARMDKTGAFGIVTHETEFQGGAGSFKPTDPVNAETLRMFDGFLAKVAEKGDAARWATVSEIAEKVE